jgi:hypothetical protein
MSMRFPGKEFKGTIQQMRLNPQNVQNVVTYNVVLDVDNPEQEVEARNDCEPDDYHRRTQTTF